MAGDELNPGGGDTSPLLIAALLAPLVVIVIVITVLGGYSFLVVLAWLVLLWGAHPLMDRGAVTSVEFDGATVSLLTRYERRDFNRSDISGIGYSGSTIARRLTRPFGQQEPLLVGRIVVVDQRGEVSVALRAMRHSVERLEQSATNSGVRWLGRMDLSTAQFGVPAVSTSAVDLITSRGVDPTDLTIMRRQASRLLVRSLVGAGALWVIVIALSVAGITDPVLETAQVLAFFGTIGMLFVVGTQRLRSRPVRTAAKILSKSGFVDVDAIVLRGAPTDLVPRVVVILDPDSGLPLDSWLVDSGPTSHWLQEFDRRRFCLAVGGASDALIRSDSGQFACLVRSTSFSKPDAIHAWAVATMNGQWRATPSAPRQ